MQHFHVFCNDARCLLKSKQLFYLSRHPRVLQLNSKKPICYWTQQGRYYNPGARRKLVVKTNLYGTHHIADSLTSKRFFHTSTFLWKTNETNQERNSNSNPDNGNSPNNNTLYLLLTVGLLGFALFTLSASDRQKKLPPTTQNNISWKDFIDKILPTGMVQRIGIVSDHQIIVFLHQECIIDGKMTSFFYINHLKNAWNVENLLREEERKLNIDPIEAIPIVSSVVPSNIYQNLFLFILLAWGVAFLAGWMRSRMSEASNLLKLFQPSVTFSSKRSNIKFKDVAGMKEAKQEVMEFVDFIKNPKHYEELGAKMPRGCLLTGPPGVGKTLLAKAVATEAEVPFIAKAGSDFVELIGGLGARRIRQLFEEARKASPCIIYIDELDALGASRAGSSGPRGGNSEKDHTLNQLLVEMDGMLSKQHQVIVLASTNRADILDKAILRPGRFDRVIPIDLPTREEREEILLYYLNKLKLDGSIEEFARKLAAPTPGMSGADLANVCNEAAIYAARENDSTVQEKHLDYAVERVIAGAPKSATSVSPAEREVVAVHESGHALIGWLLEHTDALAKVTIIPRTKAALGFARTVPSNRHLHSQEQLMDFMCMALGGRAAEELVKGNVTQGAQDDLKKVTDMAYAQVRHFGFSSKVGLLSFKEDSNVRPYSDALAQTVDQEVMELVKTAYERAKSVLSQNRHLLNTLSRELLVRESMNYDDVENLIGPPAYGEKNKIPSVPFGPYASQIDNDGNCNEKPSEANKEF